MLDLPEGVEEALTGSRQGETLTLSAWYDGACTVPSLSVASWKLSDDMTRQIRRTLDVELVDESDLLPLMVTDPLGVGGQTLALTYKLGDGTAVPLGDFVITKSAPAASWIVSKKDGLQKIVAAGVQISVTADDLTSNVKAARFLAPESPASGATAVTEIKRLCDGIVPVVVDFTVADRSVSTATVWDSERMDALDDLADTLDAALRMGSDGALHVEALSATPVWTVDGGDDGVMISIDHELAQDGLYNAAVSTSSGTDTEITGVAYVQSGPLRWDGPLGRRPIFHASPLITTQAMADKDAATHLTTTTANQSISLKITCLPHPGLQSGDYITVGVPMDGKTDFVHVTGQVQALTLQGTTAGLLPMELTVNVPVDDLAEAVRHA